MKNNLVSSLWADTLDLIRKCHLSTLNPDGSDLRWREAFALLCQSIEEERVSDADFSPELKNLSDALGIGFDFHDILEEYFDFLEEKQDWIAVIASCNRLISMFSWKNEVPSEYMYRKGNALEQSKKFDEAEKFGREWLEKYPRDLYAAASNAFLLLALHRPEDAKKITEKYLPKELICPDVAGTMRMAAYRLYEVTQDINAKQRIEKKMAEYEEFLK